MAHPHWAICDVSNPPASGYEEAVVLKNADNNNKLTPTQQAILEAIGEEFTPIEKSLDVTNTPSSSTETGDDNKVLEGKDNNMSDQNDELLALKQKIAEQDKELAIQKSLFTVSKSIAKYALDSAIEQPFAELLAGLDEAPRGVVLSVLDSLVEKAKSSEEEVQKSVDSALDTVAAVSKQLVADLTVEKGHSDTPATKQELTDVEQALEIIKQRNLKGSK